MESSPPMTSTSSVVSLNGACSNAMSPGELESMNPKSMCRMCPSRVSSRLPSLRSLTWACHLHINTYIRVHSYVHAHIYPHASRVSSRLPPLRSFSKHNPKRLPTMPRRRRYKDMLKDMLIWHAYKNACRPCLGVAGACSAPWTRSIPNGHGLSLIHI